MNKQTHRSVRLLAGFLAAASLLSACTGPGASSSSTPASPSSAASAQSPSSSGAEQAKPVPDYLNTGAQFPITKEPLTLTAMVGKTGIQPDFGDIQSLADYEKMTNIHIEWNNVLTSELGEKLGLAFASNSLPDLFVKCNISAIDVLKYGNDGALLNMKDLLPDYAPNLSGIMESYPDVRQGQYEFDGNLYALPNVMTDCKPVEVTRKMFVNKTWLDKLGLKLPTTTEELYALLVAFKSGDGNGNGVADEIPWTSDGIVNVGQLLFGAFGIQNRGTGNDLLDADPATGEPRFFKTSEGYKQWLTYCNKLYAEGLLDQEVFTNKNTNILALNEEKRVGVFGFANVAARAKNEEDFVGITEALEGPNGDKMWAAVRPKILNKGAFAVSASCKYPEAALRWVDHFYSDDGARMIYLGVEGVSYEKTGNGYDIKKEISENIPDGSSFDAEISKFAPYVGGGMPAQVNKDVFRGGEMAPIPTACSNALMPFAPKEIWPAFVYSTEENTVRSQVETDIKKYIDQTTAEFIQGKKPIAEFDSYVQQIEKMGLSQFMEINKAVYARIQ